MPPHQVTHDPLPAPLNPPGVQGFPGSPHNLSAGDTQHIITHLTPNTNYSITVCAFTNIGCGHLSHVVNQTDEDGKANSECELQLYLLSLCPLFQQLPRQSAIWLLPQETLTIITIL